MCEMKPDLMAWVAKLEMALDELDPITQARPHAVVAEVVGEMASVSRWALRRVPKVAAGAPVAGPTSVRLMCSSCNREVESEDWWELSWLRFHRHLCRTCYHAAKGEPPPREQIWLAPFACPCCTKLLLVDRFSTVDGRVEVVACPDNVRGLHQPEQDTSGEDALRDSLVTMSKGLHGPRHRSSERPEQGEGRERWGLPDLCDGCR